MSESYKKAGVDLNSAEEVTKKIAGLAKGTFTEQVMKDIGAFGGVYRFPADSNKLLIASADGVGTKLKIAASLGIYNTVGQDLVNHCINDLLTMGTRPLFFLDYIGYFDLEPEQVTRIVEGLSIACSENGVALIGGETAQMPGIYGSGDFDLVGFILGTIDEEDIVDGSSIQPGDVIIALNTNGLQTNGYSLARKVLLDSGEFSLNDKPDMLEGNSLGDALLAIHPCFYKNIRELMDKHIAIEGMAHITGGGIPGNLVRILPDNCRAIIDISNIEVPPIFELIRKTGDIPISEMYEVFNMGAGYLVVVKCENKDEAIEILTQSGVRAVECGKIEEGTKEVIVESAS